jgi:transposase
MSEFKRRRKFTKEFKIGAAEQVLVNKKGVGEVSQALDVNENNLRRWIDEYQKDKKDAFPGKGRLKPAEEALRRLERQLADVTEERDILKKAIAVFSKGPKTNTYL